MLCQVFQKKSNQVLHIKKPYYIQNRIHVERQQCILKKQSLNQGKSFLKFAIRGS